MTLLARKTRQLVSPRRRTTRPRLEPLEGRQLLSGFGPEDGAFIVEPWSGSYGAVQIQPGDQKIVAAGGGASGLAVARYDSAGNADVSYGAGGLSTPAGGGAARGLVLQPDGKAVVSTIPTSGFLGAGRLKTDGSLDTTFSSDGWTSVDASPGKPQTATGIGLQSNGQIVVGGYSGLNFLSSPRAILGGFKSNGDVNSGKGGFGQIVKGKAIGSTEATFGGRASFSSIEVQPDNKIVAVGGFSSVASVSQQLLVARYTKNGVLDTTFNGSGYTILTLPGISYTSVWTYSTDRVALQSDGKIVVLSSYGVKAVAGGDIVETDMLVTRFNANGTLDTGFGGGTGYVLVEEGTPTSPTFERGYCVAIQPDGKIIAIGAGGTAFVARLNSNGTLDSTFGAGGFKYGTQAATAGWHFEPNTAALQSDGNIIVAGRSREGEVSYPFLMRFLATTDSPMQAAGSAVLAASDAQSRPQAAVRPALTTGIARWQATGETVSRLGILEVRNANLSDTTLDIASGNTISLGFNAADWGWSVVRSSRRGRVAQPATWIDLRS